MRYARMTTYAFVGFLIGGFIAVLLDLVAIGWLLPMSGAALGGLIRLLWKRYRGLG